MLRFALASLFSLAAFLAVCSTAGAGLIASVRTHTGTLELRSAPGGKVLAAAGPRTAFGSPETFAVVARRGSWLQVTSDLLPNNTLAWLPAAAVTLRPDPYLLEIDLSTHRLRVLERGRVVRMIAVATGAPASPTPSGLFQLSDKLPGAAYSSVYGCCILALSGSQPQPPAGWRGGTRLAIHGGDGIGSSVSAGCLHAGEDDLRYLMQRLPLGTLVRIHA